MLSLQLYGQLLGWRGAEKSRLVNLGKAVAVRFIKAAFCIYPTLPEALMTRTKTLTKTNEKNDFFQALAVVYEKLFPREKKRVENMTSMFLMHQENHHCGKGVGELMKIAAVCPEKLNKKTVMAMSMCGNKKVSTYILKNLLLGFQKPSLPKISVDQFREAFNSIPEHLLPDDEEYEDGFVEMMLDLNEVQLRRFIRCLCHDPEALKMHKELIVTVLNCSGQNCSKNLCGMLKMRALRGKSAEVGSMAHVLACCVKT